MTASLPPLTNNSGMPVGPTPQWPFINPTAHYPTPYHLPNLTPQSQPSRGELPMPTFGAFPTYTMAPTLQFDPSAHWP